MSSSRTICVAAGAIALAFCTEASAQLEWRVSVKFILDANGNRPASGSLNADAEVQAQIDLGNQILDAHGRGYRLRLTEIVDLSNVSQWFSVDVSDNFKDALEAAAEASPSTYAYRSNAINVYINGDGGSGICSFPGTDDIIFLGQGVRTTTVLHEIGHYMNLCHAQGCPCGSCDTDAIGLCNTIPGDDSIGDTLPDLSCWDRDDISNWSYGSNYSGLSSARQDNVDDVFFNTMSYHDTRNRLTSDQLDVSTDTSNGARNNAATGNTFFVDSGANPLLPFGTSSFPFINVITGVAVTGSGDIVMIRGGTYNEPQTIIKAVSLLASRGSATIGEPAGRSVIEEDRAWLDRLPDTGGGRTGP